ncbi:hypothetical protein B0J12DRAFT_775657 [Macrophomina phaseolina]|uniref:medium-chain acyl-CoA ligase n=1 Tax=Macrophomina phaseolina TaxID=35725 RepID=A0ABQ8FR54_9PEZI|nr:hypothetical protein B0J12DRAFT_775657 [Macrophomina phaseolina]
MLLVPKDIEYRVRTSHATAFVGNESSVADTCSSIKLGQAAWSLFGAWSCGAALFALHDADAAFSPAHLLHVLRRFPITTPCAPPTAYRQAVALVAATPPQQRRLPALEHCVSASEALDGETAAAWCAAVGVRIRQGSGQTETALLCGEFPGAPTKAGAMGKAALGMLEGKLYEWDCTTLVWYSSVSLEKRLYASEDPGLGTRVYYAASPSATNGPGSSRSSHDGRSKVAVILPDLIGQPSYARKEDQKEDANVSNAARLSVGKPRCGLASDRAHEAHPHENAREYVKPRSSSPPLPVSAYEASLYRKPDLVPKVLQHTFSPFSRRTHSPLYYNKGESTLFEIRFNIDGGMRESESVSERKRHSETAERDATSLAESEA